MHTCTALSLADVVGACAFAALQVSLQKSAAQMLLDRAMRYPKPSRTTPHTRSLHALL